MKYNKYRVVFLEKIGLTAKERIILIEAVNLKEAIIIVKKTCNVKRIKSVNCIFDGNVNIKIF